MKKGALDSLNLRPSERRLVVVIGLVMFFVLNLWVVVPHFKDWGKVQFRMDKARRMLAMYRTEVAQMPVYQARVRELGSENSNIPVEEQQLHFANTRESVASQAGVTIANASRVNTRTNQFFLELTQTINLICKEPQLVDFLYNLGSGNSLIRVRDLSLRPDPARYQLNTSVKLAASYQKRPVVRPATAPPGTAPSPARGRTNAPPVRNNVSSSSKPAPPTGAPASLTSK